jgi:hypothetical protein
MVSHLVAGKIKRHLRAQIQLKFHLVVKIAGLIMTKSTMIAYRIRDSVATMQEPDSSIDTPNQTSD